MGGGKGDDSGEDQEIALEQKEYQQDLQEQEEEVDKLNKEEMGFLHSEGGLTYIDSAQGNINNVSGMNNGQAI